MKKARCLLFLFLFLQSAFAQQKYWISFTDKTGVEFNPLLYFSERTILQRQLQNISLYESSDVPVNPEYISAVSQIVQSTSWPSRWLNGIAVFASPEQVKQVSELPFVKSFEMMNSQFVSATINNKKVKKYIDAENELLNFQTQRMQGDSFLVHNLNGQGIRIAVFDVGFPGVDKNPVFSHLRNEKKIISTYDFVKHTENVYRGHWHGTATLSCIGGKKDSTNIGLATGAEFLLARTEKLLCEDFSEEENWLAAAEWADRNGANIISSSLGYTYHRYFNNEMNGHTSLVSRSATIAASKGILVINAAGNDGDNSWHTINAPADADSVLTVGGTDPKSDLHIYFSSFGPASDGRLKPNVCALAEVIASNKEALAEMSGTSFSTPLVAGFAACAWQSNRQWSNMELFNAIEQSSHLYPYFDYAHGFGIPQAGRLTSTLLPAEATFDFVIINNEIKVLLRDEYSHPETEEALGYNVRRNFYYKTEDKDGVIRNYFVLLADRKEMLHFFTEDFQTGDALTVHFEGYTSTLDFTEEIK